MIIETQKLSPTELIIYFPTPMRIIGCLHNNDQLPQCDTIKNINSINLAKEILLTSDFLYLKSNSEDSLEILKSFSLSELDDFYASASELIASSENIKQKIQLILKLIVAPYLKKDGGDIELVSYQNNTTYVRFLGKCNGCPYAMKTLKERVEKNLIRYLPEMQEAVLT